MILYRCVNSDFDPINKGDLLTRSSDHSRQKLGNGIYFAQTFQDAKRFLAGSHGHTYTHILECELSDISIDDLFDSRENPHAVNKSNFAKLSVSQRNFEYCKSIGKKGMIWSTIDEISEVCVFNEYINNNIKISNSTVI